MNPNRFPTRRENLLRKLEAASSSVPALDPLFPQMLLGAVTGIFAPSGPNTS